MTEKEIPDPQDPDDFDFPVIDEISHPTAPRRSIKSTMTLTAAFEAAAKGEEIKVCRIGPLPPHWVALPKHFPYASMWQRDPRADLLGEPTGELLPWSKAASLLDWEWNESSWITGPDLPPVWAWTDNLELFISANDHKSKVEALPRHPESSTHPRYIGPDFSD